MVSLSLTLSDLEGHFGCWKLLRAYSRVGDDDDDNDAMVGVCGTCKSQE